MKQKQNILNLKPTQFAVGMLEVDEKIKELAHANKKKKKKFFNGTKVPVVRSPDGDLYVVDKHHFLWVCFQLGIKKVKIDLIKDFKGKKISYGAFWKWMGKTRNWYPFCQFGEGTRKEFYLPKDVRGLADDPYRSMAWFVRKAGAFENSEKNFAEFSWANFFRSKKLLEREGMNGITKALVRASRLAQSAEARHLPGYDKINSKKQMAVEKKLRVTGKKIAKKDKKLKQILGQSTPALGTT
jgi:hypothetical protein